MANCLGIILDAPNTELRQVSIEPMWSVPVQGMYKPVPYHGEGLQVGTGLWGRRQSGVMTAYRKGWRAPIGCSTQGGWDSDRRGMQSVAM